jgi:hypothetical protein
MNQSGIKQHRTEPQNTEQGIMNIEVGQPSVAAMEVGAEADPALTFLSITSLALFYIQKT